MTFEEAIKKSIKAYFEAREDEKSAIDEMAPDRKYTRSYFEAFEKEQLELKEEKQSKKIRKAKHDVSGSTEIKP